MHKDTDEINKAFERYNALQARQLQLDSRDDLAQAGGNRKVGLRARFYADCDKV